MLQNKKTNLFVRSRISVRASKRTVSFYSNILPRNHRLLRQACKRGIEARKANNQRISGVRGYSLCDKIESYSSISCVTNKAIHEIYTYLESLWRMAWPLPSNPYPRQRQPRLICNSLQHSSELAGHLEMTSLDISLSASTQKLKVSPAELVTKWVVRILQDCQQSLAPGKQTRVITSGAGSLTNTTMLANTLNGIWCWK